MKHSTTPWLVLLAWLPLQACAPALELRTPCNSDEDCSDGMRCRSGVCEVHTNTGPLPPGGDTARDAGADAGPGDRSDAGSLDGGAGDAGVNDGGARDAGSVDGGTLDGGTLDGGVDAGEIDPPWWDPAFRARRMLRFQNAFQGESLQGFPVLVVLDDDVIDLSRVAAGGRDLRFVDDDGETVLPHEIERFDPSGTSYVWVRVPGIDARSSTDHVWLYYDNPTATDVENPDALWQDYALVLHGNGGNAGLVDSAPDGHGGFTPSNTREEGIAGQGVSLDGDGQSVEVPSLGGTAFPQERGTVTMWVKGALGSQGQSDNLFDQWSDARDHLFLRASGGGDLQAVAQLTGDIYAGSEGRYGWSSAERFHLLGLSYDVPAQRIRLFVDASSYNPVPLSTAWSPAQQEVGFGRGFRGVFDEMRIATLARSSSWMRAEYLNGTQRFVLLDPPKVPPAAAPRVLSRVDGPVVLYDFDEGQGTSVADTSGFGAPLPLSIRDEDRVAWLPGGLRFSSPTIAASASGAEKIVAAVQESGAITVEAWVMPDNPLLDGPSRIVTLSRNTSERAFTLGQDPDGVRSGHYNLRFRTSTTTSANGTDNAAPGATGMPRTSWSSIDDGAPQHVVFTRDASGHVHAYLDGVEVESFEWPGDLSVWSASWRLGLGNEFDDNGGTSYLPRPWLGTLYLVAIYDRVLSPDEVLQNYAAGP